MKHQLIQEIIPYTGEALSNHWIYKNFGILGDAVVAFNGPCEVTTDRLVDLEDVLNDDAIFSRLMLNFIVEIFDISLREGVLVQRLFSSILADKINERLGSNSVRRMGDDLFYQEMKKLSVSICTVSPTSILIHTGLNIDAVGAPVEAAGLTSDLEMKDHDIEQLAISAMKTLVDEWQDTGLSCCKVKAVA